MPDWTFWEPLLFIWGPIIAAGVGLLAYVGRRMGDREKQQRARQADQQLILQIAGEVVTMSQTIVHQAPRARKVVRSNAVAAGQLGGSIQKRQEAEFDQMAADARDLAARAASIVPTPDALKTLENAELAELVTGLQADRIRILALKADFDGKAGEAHRDTQILLSTPKPFTGAGASR